MHIVYTENIQSPDCTGCFHVFYRQSDDIGLTWSPAVDISRWPTRAPKPQLVIDEANNLHVVWEAGYGGDRGQLSEALQTQLMVTSSSARRHTCSTPTALSA